jgi:uncharacterized membrane protein
MKQTAVDGQLKRAHPTRISAVDAIRGFAMLLMLLSHTTWRIPNFDYRVAFGWDNMIVPDLSQAHAFIGFVLQAASPIFFLLAGVSLAMFVASRQARGWSSCAISRFLIVRGLVLIVLDLTIVNFDLLPQRYGYRISVLTAVGLCLISMAFLRRLSLPLLSLIALGLTVFTQGLFGLYGQPFSDSLLVAVLLAPQHTAPWSVEFSLLPWLPVVLLGYISMRLIQTRSIQFERLMAAAAAALGFAWVVVIAMNSFGTLYQDRRLIFTKHPPDLSYLLVYLAFACLLLSAYHVFERRMPLTAARILCLLGQNALIFYVLHPKILDIAYVLIEDTTRRPFALSLLLALISLPPLLLMCAVYGKLKQRYPTSVLRYL